MNRFGFARVSVCSPEVVVADPAANAAATVAMLRQCADSDVAVFPELGITGYTCADLFRQSTLLAGAERQVAQVAAATEGLAQLVVLGAPVRVAGELFNCAVVIHDGHVIGLVPKQHIPNYNEFYEKRWFRPADDTHQGMEVEYAGRRVPFGIDLLFEARDGPDFTVFIEVCEDLFMPIPPSSIACMYGATLLCNLSASPETVAKYEYRMELVRNQSGRCLAGYAYASSGPSESTTDLVFSGHCIIAEHGNTLAETSHIGDGKLDFGPRLVTADVDVQRCMTERQLQETFADGRRHVRREYRRIAWRDQRETPGLKRHIAATPFVPTDPATLAQRCAAIFDIQCAALAKRIRHLNFPDLQIGISGGLDSTHALLVAHKTLQSLGVPVTKIKAKTMPGFGTTAKTRGIALDLMRLLRMGAEEIDIRPFCMQAFRDLGHKPFGIGVSDMTLEQFTAALRNVPAERRHDLVFENVQARARTFFLMNSGFVLGTGDMSEAALGWSTYNGDQMSMYNVNFGVPKTLIRFMVRYVADHHYPAGPLRDTLHASAGLTISPELLPAGDEGQIVQDTEATVGPYVLNDFYLLNFVRYGFSPEKILFLSDHSELAKLHTREERRQTLRTFITRFFGQQFKRTAVPDGPKVGTVALSPRGDWRMPTDASAQAWLASLDEEEQGGR